MTAEKAGKELSGNLIPTSQSAKPRATRVGFVAAGLGRLLLVTGAITAHAAGSGCTDVAPIQDMTGATLAPCNAAGLISAIQLGGRVRLQACTAPIVLTVPIAVNADVVFDGGGATLSGGGTSGIFVVAPLRHAQFQNLHLNNGMDNTAGSVPGGGAVRGAQFGYLTFINVSFDNNIAQGMGGEDGGGAIFKDEGGKLTVFNSTFSNNLATNGGAIKALLSDVQIVESTFIGNSARGGNNGGGGFFLDGLAAKTLPTYAPAGATVDGYGKGRFCGLWFENNTVGNTLDVNNTGRQGGGLFTHTYTVSGASARIEIERSVFDNNHTAQDGGGLRIGTSDDGGDGGSAILTHVVLGNNRASNHGGAVRLSNANANFNNVSIVGNCAGDTASVCQSDTDAGGGLGGGIATFDRVYDVQRLTVVRNRAAGFSGGLSTRQGGQLLASIVAANSVGNSYGVTRNCGSPSMLGGAASFEWPAPAGDQYEPGCGAGTIADPAVQTTAVTCTEQIGSSLQNVALSSFPPGTVVPRSVGVPTAGAVCPEQLDVIFANGFQ